MLTKKNIIFDYDGTLVEFPVRYMFEETHRIDVLLGREAVSDDELEECFSDFDFFRFARKNDDTSAEEAYKEAYWKEFNWDTFPLGKPFTETIQTLQALQGRGYVLSIATARVTTPEELLSEMNRCGIGKFFSLDLIQTRNSHLDEWRDKSKQIAKVLSFSGISAENSIIVGDIPADIVSGREMQLKHTIAVQSGGIKKQILEASEPDGVLNNLGDLPNFLLDLSF